MAFVSGLIYIRKATSWRHGPRACSSASPFPLLQVAADALHDVLPDLVVLRFVLAEPSLGQVLGALRDHTVSRNKRRFCRLPSSGIVLDVLLHELPRLKGAWGFRV